jgi:hypothetical protein
MSSQMAKIEKRNLRLESGQLAHYKLQKMSLNTAISTRVVDRA